MSLKFHGRNLAQCVGGKTAKLGKALLGRENALWVLISCRLLTLRAYYHILSLVACTPCESTVTEEGFLTSHVLPGTPFDVLSLSEQSRSASGQRADSMCREQGVGIGGAEPMMGEFDHGDI